MNFNDYLDKTEGDISPGGIFYRSPQKGILRIFTQSPVPLVINFSSRENAVRCRDNLLQMRMEGQIYSNIADGGVEKLTVILSTIQYMVIE